MTALHSSLASLGIVALIAAVYFTRKQQEPMARAVSLTALILVAGLVLSGAGMWFAGMRPSGPFLSWLHLLLGIGALVHLGMAMHSGRRTASFRTIAIAGALALGAFIIGHAG